MRGADDKRSSLNEGEEADRASGRVKILFPLSLLFHVTSFVGPPHSSLLSRLSPSHQARRHHPANLKPLVPPVIGPLSITLLLVLQEDNVRRRDPSLSLTLILPPSISSLSVPLSCSPWSRERPVLLSPFSGSPVSPPLLMPFSCCDRFIYGD